MSNINEFPPDTLKDIAKQIGIFLPSILNKGTVTATTKIMLAETFVFWVLVGSLELREGKDIRQLTECTYQWHHQILIDGKALAFARSTPKDGDPKVREISQISASYRAEKIDKAIKWIDEHIKYEVEARLLVARAYQLHAFWLEGADSNQIVVIDCPESLHPCLQPLQLIRAENFVAALRKEQPLSGRICEGTKDEYSNPPKGDVLY